MRLETDAELFIFISLLNKEGKKKKKKSDGAIRSALLGALMESFGSLSKSGAAKREPTYFRSTIQTLQ